MVRGWVGLSKERFAGPTICPSAGWVTLLVPNLPAQGSQPTGHIPWIPASLASWPGSPQKGQCCRTTTPCLTVAGPAGCSHADRGMVLYSRGIHGTIANFMTNSIPKIQHNYFYNVVFEVKNSN